MKELQERLGHASAKVTLDTYAHLMPAAERPGGGLNRLVTGFSAPRA